MAVATPLTTADEMELEVGQDALLAWSDHDNANIRDDDAVSRAIDRATSEIQRTAGQRYSLTGLSANQEIRAWATILACFFLNKSRGMHPADSLADDVEYIREQLKEIAQGKQTIQGVALKDDLRPVMTNREIDRRFSYRTVRKRPDSTGPHSKLREDRVTHVEEV